MHTNPLIGSWFWFLSFVLVGADIIIVSVLLFGVHRALLGLGRTKADRVRIVSTLGIVLFGWLVLALFLGWRGIFSSALNQPVPYIALAIGIPILVGALFIRGSKQIREIIAAVLQSQLVAFQFYRVLGVTFLVLYAAGQLPGIFALPAGWGDVMVGLTALWVGARAARTQSDQLVTLWNWFGISDFAIAVATGFLSAPGRFQIFSLDAPNVLIGSFPLVMIPIFAVPLSTVLHLASLSKIWAAHRSVMKQAVSA
ncbi:MAG: hypothetical protein WB696_23500 [Chthoniobacterales bacterium]